MTAISLTAPYAPQPSQNAPPDSGLPSTQTAAPTPEAKTGNLTGNASDQSGQGPGNGTGTGGAQIAALIKQSRIHIEVQRPTPRSVVEARSGTKPAADFLDRQEQQRITARAVAEARAADRAAVLAAEAKAEAAKAARPEVVMPNPMPTAPILRRDED